MTNDDKMEEGAHLPSPTIHDLQLAKAQGVQSLGAMLERYGCRIRHHIRSAGAPPGDIEDLEGEVQIRLLEKLPATSFETVGEFRAWVKRVATNLTIDFLRRGNRNPVKRSLDALDSPSGSSFEVAASQAGVPTQVHGRQGLDKIQAMRAMREAAIARLPSPMRELVEMREQKGMQFAEIAAEQSRRAQAMGITKAKTEDSVRVAYSRLIAQIGEPLGGGSSALPRTEG